MKYDDNDRAIALAGLFQACHLAQQVAHKGMADAQALTGNIHSLFQVDTAQVLDVFGSLQNLAPGLRLAHRQLSGSEPRDNELTRYLLSLVQLERKLIGDAERLESISEGIKSTAARLPHFPQTHSNILASLADIYAGNISTLQPRIMVSGEPVYLQNPDNVNRIRALLLAGIRAAMLWRQMGGRRRQLLFNRKRVVTTLHGLLDSL
ncbi:MAG: high frequency lysogenization protein HflD [Candidatus Thiodiazotropha sp. (ex Myrtea sp. 'scaly one' KF741663)]|nr:high frequency lysogenization protein HflD [Candidatus Thiodiazotropha sp. (ex Myrtea sp. 'scaly one' KF741663)]